MKFGLNQVGNDAPHWVVKTVAVGTIVLQLLPAAIDNSTIISPFTNELINLSCKILNIALAGLAVFFGVSSESE